MLVHLPGVVPAAITFFEVWSCAEAMRDLDISPIAILSVSTLVVSATLIFLSRLMPKVLLGEDGIWMSKTVSVYVSEKLKPILRFQQAL